MLCANNRVNFGIHLLAFITALFGLVGAAKCHSTAVIIHCTVTTGIVGSFFIYEIISAMFRRDNHLDETHITETWMLLLLSIPYLLDLAIGVYGCFFAATLLDPEKPEDKEKLDNEYENELQNFQRNTADNNICCICMEAPKNCAFIPCGHECTCYECAADYLERRPDEHRKCIICRENKVNFILLNMFIPKILRE